MPRCVKCHCNILPGDSEVLSHWMCASHAGEFFHWKQTLRRMGYEIKAINPESEDELIYTITRDKEGTYGLFGPTPDKESCMSYLCKYEGDGDMLYLWEWTGQVGTLETQWIVTQDE